MRTHNFTSITGTITYPDSTIYSSDNNFITCQLSLAPTQYLELSFTVEGVLYKDVNYFDSNIKVRVSISEILDLIFSKSEDSIFETDITTFTILAKIIDSSTGGTDDFKLITFEHVMLGKREVGDVIDTIFENGNFESGISNLFYFYLNGTNKIFVSENNGGSYTDLGTFYKGINHINLDSFSKTDLIFILGDGTSTFDSTFDSTFGNPGKKIKQEIITCTDDRTVRMRYNNRFGLWKYKNAKRTNKNYSVSGLVKLPYEKGNDYSGMFFDKNKESENLISIFSEEQTKNEQREWKDLIESNHVTMYVNGVWLPVEVATNQILIDEKLEAADVNINLLIQQ